jgi:magnesium transporter
MARLPSLSGLLGGLTGLRQLVRRASPPGEAPGTLEPAAEGRPTSVRVLGYGGDGIVDREVADLAELTTIRSSCSVVWVDVDGLGDTERLQGLARALGLHPLAMEDAVTTYQRPKIEVYPDHLFIVVRMVDLAERLRTEQLAIFSGAGFVVTLQGELPGDSLDPVRDRIRAGRGRLGTAGADYLAYALVDAVTDHYFPVLDELGGRLERLEREVLNGGGRDIPVRVQAAKYDLMTARRLVLPLRDAVASVVRDENLTHVSSEVRLYFRDCLDHTRQLADVVDSYREIANGLLDLHFSSMSHRMNEVMKLLTLVSSVFIPLSFVAGVYGMNFDPDRSPWNMPELRWEYGYPLALGLMAIMAVSALTYFWSKGWLR